MERKLAAILYADVAGYSRLMGEDEEGTHRILSAHLDAITAAVEDKGGSVVHFAGDAVLAEFASVVTALDCGVAIQRDLAIRNEGTPDDRKVVFRVGVNIGDVMVDRDDLFGDGVNVAARLESLAEPGGICISGKVYEEVRDKLDLEYVDLGKQEVKNIRRPVQAYRVRAPGFDLSSPGAGAKPARRWGRYAAAAIGVLAVAGVAAWLLSRPAPRIVDPDSSIAVLRFENSSRNEEHLDLVEGLTDDLITDLSKFSGLRVTPRNVSRHYPPDAVPGDIARDLGIRFVVTGSVREATSDIRVNVDLFDAAVNSQPWAERYNKSQKELIDLTCEISRKIVDVVAVKLTAEEEARACVRGTENPEAYKAFVKGQSAYLQRTPDDFVKAEAQLKLALAIDPDYARAHSALAATYWETFQRYWHRKLNLSPVGAAWVKAEEHLQVAMASPDSRAHRVNSEMLTRTRRHDEAEREARLALALDSNNPFNYVALAQALTFAGKVHEAEALARLAIEMDKSHQPSFEFVLGNTLYGLEKYEEAAAVLRKATQANPEDHLQYVYLVAALGRLGRKDDAAEAIAALEELRRKVRLPSFNVSETTNQIPYKERVDLDRLQEGLRAAGVPEY